MRVLSNSLKICVAVFLFIGMGCATSNSSSQQDSSSENKVTSSHELMLEDYLRKLNGVQVSGSGGQLNVTIRSNMSISNPDQQPLYVLNGQEIGDSYGQIYQLVDHSSIVSVEAIPPSQSSSYGMRGGSGVIVIKTE